MPSPPPSSPPTSSHHAGSSRPARRPSGVASVGGPPPFGQHPGATTRPGSARPLAPSATAGPSFASAWPPRAAGTAAGARAEADARGFGASGGGAAQSCFERGPAPSFASASEQRALVAAAAAAAVASGAFLPGGGGGQDGASPGKSSGEGLSGPAAVAAVEEGEAGAGSTSPLAPRPLSDAADPGSIPSPPRRVRRRVDDDGVMAIAAAQHQPPPPRRPAAARRLDWPGGADRTLRGARVPGRVPVPVRVAGVAGPYHRRDPLEAEE